jgi:hypothetical protein
MAKTYSLFQMLTALGAGIITSLLLCLILCKTHFIDANSDNTNEISIFEVSVIHEALCKLLFEYDLTARYEGVLSHDCSVGDINAQNKNKSWHIYNIPLETSIKEKYAPLKYSIIISISDDNDHHELCTFSLNHHICRIVSSDSSAVKQNIISDANMSHHPAYNKTIGEILKRLPDNVRSVAIERSNQL